MHGWEQELRARLERATGGIPCVTFSRAIVTALTYLGLRRVVVATASIDELHRVEEQSVTVNRAEVPAIRGLGIRRPTDINKCSSKDALDLALALPHRQADGNAISCTNVRTIEVLSELEHWTGKSGFSSQVAALWAVLRWRQWPRGPAPGRGRLLAT